MMDDNTLFDECGKISALLNERKEDDARNMLIQLLDKVQKQKLPYTDFLNHLIRETGLFPYFKSDSADWKDALAYEMFKADVGGNKEVALHREQSVVLKKLLGGINLAVSAPTSFGKSLIIDAFIAIKKPKNVVLIVPTIALMDETRRRLYRKFSRDYEIITQSDSSLGSQNIFILPPERALAFSGIITNIDILVIDEFYKASVELDSERAPAVIKCIMEFSSKSAQRYYLAPNISYLVDNPFTKDMEFYPTEFNTVFLNKTDYCSQVKNFPETKSTIFLDVLKKNPGKTLVYAGTFTEIKKLNEIYLSSQIVRNRSALLDSFSEWLVKNYEPDWGLSNLVKNGVGMHNGRMHRSLAQIQVKLFDEKDDGLNDLISTSSIIEGVNTTAENVVVWKNKNGNKKLNFFTYKNIVGRGGRMLRHFVGNAFFLDKTPKEEETQLSITFPEETILNPDLLETFDVSKENLEIIKKQQYDIELELGKESFANLKDDFYSLDVKKKSVSHIIRNLKDKASKWNGLSHLNSNDPNQWDFCLKQILFLMHSIGDVDAVNRIAAFVKALSHNWDKSIAEILESVSEYDFGIDDFFEWEKKITYNFVQFFSLFNGLQKNILKQGHDISPFIQRMKSAFLPPVVLQLEEFGLPRMISKKIHNAGVINFEDDSLTTKSAIKKFDEIGKNQICQIKSLDSFDKYIVDFFYDGI